MLPINLHYAKAFAEGVEGLSVETFGALDRLIRILQAINPAAEVSVHVQT